MKDLLKKLKLIVGFTTELEISQDNFVSRMQEHVDAENVGMISDLFESFSRSKNDFKGTVKHDGFKIRKRLKFFETNRMIAFAKGTFTQKGDALIIETEINGFGGVMIPLFVFLPIIYIIFAVVLFTNDDIKWFIIPFILAYTVIMFGIPYFIMRSSIKLMKQELEKEFYYWAKK
jgi:hypothetical protein